MLKLQNLTIIRGKMREERASSDKTHYFIQINELHSDSVLLNFDHFFLVRPEIAHVGS